MLYLICTGFTRVQRNAECSGSEIEKALQRNARRRHCADACEGVSSMFLFSRRQNRCFCETAATPEGTCDVIDIRGWTLFKYGGSFLIV